jgi:LysR family cys regulon transcriptional activator
LELEEELGVDIFSRHGKRLRRITEPGERVLRCIDVILREVGNLRRIGEEYSRQDSGILSIATTHTRPAMCCRRRWPSCAASSRSCRSACTRATRARWRKWCWTKRAVIGLATESLEEFGDLVSLPWYEWQHVAVLPRDHPLAAHATLSLEQLASHPLVTYHPSFTGRSRIDRAFAARGLQPQVVLEAIDADVIKTYVRFGLGVGIVAEMAMREDPPDGDLVARPLGHLFGSNLARVAFKRGVVLRNHVLVFAELLSARLATPLLKRALAGDASHFDL